MTALFRRLYRWLRHLLSHIERDEDIAGEWPHTVQELPPQDVISDVQTWADEVLTDEEREAKRLLESADDGPKHDVIAYPAKVEDLDVGAWVTAELEKRTGGLTRHPLDITDYPTAPNEADLAARQWVKEHSFGPRAAFSHGYSMRYLRTLQARAKAQDTSLSTEDLMALRARGLV